MSPDAHGLHLWVFPTGSALFLILASIVYLRGWRRLRIALPKGLNKWRLAAAMTGILATWAAIGSPLAALDHEFLTVHMVQHLLLMTVAAPLLLLGAPVIALLNGLPRPLVNRVLRPIVRWSPAHKLEPGAFHFLPGKAHHAAEASGEVVVQVHGTGPFYIHYLKPADDPRKAKSASK